MANEATRILGLDPGLRRTGWGVVVAEGARLRWIAHGVVTPDDKAPFAQRLLHLLDAVAEICSAHACDEAARSSDATNEPVKRILCPFC